MINKIDCRPDLSRAGVIKIMPLPTNISILEAFVLQTIIKFMQQMYINEELH